MEIARLVHLRHETAEHIKSVGDGEPHRVYLIPDSIITVVDRRADVTQGVASVSAFVCGVFIYYSFVRDFPHQGQKRKPILQRVVFR